MIRRIRQLWNRTIGVWLWRFMWLRSPQGLAARARESHWSREADKFWAKHRLSFEITGPDVADRVLCACGWVGDEAHAAGHLETAHTQHIIERDRLKVAS